MLHKMILILSTFAVLCGQYQAHQTEVKNNKIEDSVRTLKGDNVEPGAWSQTCDPSRVITKGNPIKNKRDFIVFIQSLYNPESFHDMIFYQYKEFGINSTREALTNARNFLKDTKLEELRKLVTEKIKPSAKQLDLAIFSPEHYHEIDCLQVSRPFSISISKKELSEVNKFLKNTELQMLSWNELSRSLFAQSSHNKTAQVINYWIWFLLTAFVFFYLSRKIMWLSLIIATLALCLSFSYQTCNHQTSSYRKEALTGTSCSSVESWPRWFLESISWTIEFPVNYGSYGSRDLPKRVKVEPNAWSHHKAERKACDWSRVKPLGNPINNKKDLIVFIQSLFHPKNFNNADSFLYTEFNIKSTKEELISSRKFLKRMKLHQLGELVTEKINSSNKQTVNEMFSPKNFEQKNCYQASQTFIVNITKEQLTEVNNFLKNEEQQVLLWNELTRRLINFFQNLVVYCIPLILTIIVRLSRKKMWLRLILFILILNYALCNVGCNRQKKIEQIIAYQQNIQKGNPCQLVMAKEKYFWIMDFLIQSISCGTIKSPEEVCLEHMRQKIYVDAEFCDPLEVLFYNLSIIPFGFMEIILPAIICICRSSHFRQILTDTIKKPLIAFVTSWFQRYLHTNVISRLQPAQRNQPPSDS